MVGLPDSASEVSRAEEAAIKGGANKCRISPTGHIASLGGPTRTGSSWAGGVTARSEV
jgi:hypothetical protein